MFQKTVEPDADGSLCLLALIMHLSLKGGYLIEYLATLLKDKLAFASQSKGRDVANDKRFPKFLFEFLHTTTCR